MLTVAGVTTPAIDLRLPFVPERLTALAYTPIYQQLSSQERLLYNQSYGLYINEQTAAFEMELTDFMLAVANLACARDLRSDLLRLVLDEERHAAAFRSLNRRAAPQLYAHTDSVFVRPTPWQSALTEKLMRAPTVFPFLLWVILLMEERALYYSKIYQQEGHLLEPSFTAMQRLHGQDEGKHVAIDERLIRLLWESRPSPLKRLNSFLLRKIFAEFLYYPKRAALQVVLVTFPDHRWLPAMVEQILALKDNPEFLCSLYNRSTNPHTLLLMDRYPELAPVARMAEGYRP